MDCWSNSLVICVAVFTFLCLTANQGRSNRNHLVGARRDDVQAAGRSSIRACTEQAVVQDPFRFRRIRHY